MNTTSKKNDEIYAAFDVLWADLQTEQTFPGRRPLLAHYTSIDTLERIMKDDEIWFSNPLYMNDLEEVRAGINDGASAFRASIDIKLACKTQRRHDRLVAEFDGYHNKYVSDDVFDTYVFCLSEHDPDKPDGLLSMWRGYGNNGNGAAIIFDTTKISPVENSPLVISKVKYASRDGRVDRIEQKIVEFSKILAISNVPEDKLFLPAYALFNRLKIEAIFTKHHGFGEEREWRVAYLKELDRDGRLEGMLQYTIGRRGIEPKLKFKIEPVLGLTENDLSLEKIVHQILLGPSVSSPLAVRSVKRMLENISKQKLTDRLIGSTTPFRPS